MRIDFHSARHVPQLDGVRALSIGCVIAGHALPIGLSSWGLNPVVANAGLALFFILSGYLIVTLLQNGQGLGEFLVRRLVRIVPAFYLFVLTMGVLLHWPWDKVLLNLTFVSNYAQQALGVGAVHLWSICVEVHFYLAIALIVALFGRRALWLVVPAALGVTALRIYLGVPFSYLTHLRVDEILAGGALALIAPHVAPWIQRVLRRPDAAVLALIGSALALGAAASPTMPIVPYLRPYLAATVVAVLIFADIPAVTRMLISAPAAYVARMSYALYLYHWSILLILFEGAGGTVARYLLWRPVGLVVLWATAHLSTSQWERPWQRLARTPILRSRTSSHFPAE